MTSDGRALRVALIAEGGLWGGLEVHLCQLVEGLEALSADVELHCFVLEEGSLLVRLAGSERVATVPLVGYGRVGAVRCLRGVVREAGIQVLHAHGLVPEVLGALATTATPCALIATAHSRPSESRWRSETRSASATFALWIARRFFADKLIAVSGDIEERLVKLGVERGRIARIHNGVALDGSGAQRSADEVRHGLGLAPGDFVIASVGRLDGVKRPERVLGIVEALRRRGVPAVALVVGDGPLRADLERQVRERRLEAAVRMLGFRRDVAELLRAADVGVFTSDHEGIPYAALECMASGVPIVAFRVGGLPEIVADGETGILVEPYDEDRFVSSVEALWREAATRERMSARSREIAEREFSRDAMVRRIVALWQAVAAGARRRSGRRRPTVPASAVPRAPERGDATPSRRR